MYLGWKHIADSSRLVNLLTSHFQSFSPCVGKVQRFVCFVELLVWLRFSTGTPWECAVFASKIFQCTCNGLVCSLRSHLCSFFPFYSKQKPKTQKARNQQTNKPTNQQTKKSKIAHPTGGELGPVILFCLFLCFIFLGLWSLVLLFSWVSGSGLLFISLKG